MSLQVLILTFLVMYCTNALKMNAALVGTILLVSKIIDAFTSIAFGMLVDRTHTRWGRGRPYDLMIIGLWAATWLDFSVPAGASLVIKVIWIFVTYTVAQSIFRAFMTAANVVYQVRAFNNQTVYFKLNSWGAIITTTCAVVFNVVMPNMVAKVTNNAAGWSRIALFIAIPMTLIGLIRFFLIPEKYDVDVDTDRLTLKEVIKLFKLNKSIYPLMIFQLLFSICTSLSLNQYYYLYVSGDLGMMGTVSLFQMIAMLAMVFFPAILKKISTRQLVTFSLIMSLGFGTCTYIANGGFLLTAIGAIFWGLTSLAPSYMLAVLIIECADYNEWRGLPRMEGIISGAGFFFQSLGQALGSFIGGIVLTTVGFDGALPQQTAATISRINFANAWVPTIGCLLAAMAMHFYHIDKLKPQIDADLATRRAEAKPSVTTEALDTNL